MPNQEFFEENKDRFLNELIELLKIPSISADSAYKESMLDTADWLKNSLIQAGIDQVEIIPTKGFPVVFGEKMVDPSLPTVLVYGHYDVQPVDPLNLWDSPPFEPVIKDGKIYARGACDDKGQMFMHIKAVECMLANHSLACNVKFMIEGEEEIGSPNLGDFVANNKEKLQADIILISDTAIVANDIPSVETGLRGLSYFEVKLIGANRDLHSGVFGGAVPNPINILCDIISSMKDENNHITIPGFYEDVLELSPFERAEMAKVPFNLEEYKKELKIEEVIGEKGYSTLERASIRPTLDVNGIWGGYTGEGAKTVLPSEANAKISMRLVPNQRYEKINQLFTDYFMSKVPKGIKAIVKPEHGGEPYVMPMDDPGYQAAFKAMQKGFGKDPVPTRGGGSIPIVALFEELLGVKSVLLGFGLDTDDIHSPNEHYGLFNFYKGIETIPHFYAEYAQLKK